MGKSERISTSSSGNTTSIKSGHGRYCHIVKRPDFDGYGFNLHSEKVKPGQYIGKVDPNSPAEAAGLHEGDQIIEVNGVNIKNETHKQVVQRIKAISNEVRLLLTDVCIEDDPTEKNLVSSKQISNITTNQKSTSTTLIAQESSTSLLSAMPSTQTDEPDHKEMVTTINMTSTKLKSTNNNDSQSDTASNSTNGFHNKSNGEIAENNSTPTRKSIDSAAPSVEQLSVSSFQDTDISNKIGLNLSLTAAEMRAKLQAKKKFDPKNESVDLKKKFDIIQKL